MALRVQIDLDNSAIREILLSTEVRQEMIRRGNVMANAVRRQNPRQSDGSLAIVDVQVGDHPQNRHHVFVRLNDEAGTALEARHRYLARAIDAAGGD